MSEVAGATIPECPMTASALLTNVSGVCTIFLNICMRTQSIAADRLLSTPYCSTATVLSACLVIASSTWSRVQENAWRARICSHVGARRIYIKDRELFFAIDSIGSGVEYVFTPWLPELRWLRSCLSVIFVAGGLWVICFCLMAFRKKTFPVLPLGERTGARETVCSAGWYCCSWLKRY